MLCRFVSLWCLLSLRGCASLLLPSPVRILHSAVPCLPCGLHESVLVHASVALTQFPFLEDIDTGHAWYVVDLVPDVVFTAQNITTLLLGKRVPGTVRVWTLPRAPADDREWGVWMDAFPYHRLRGPTYHVYTNNCIHYARDMVRRMRSEGGTKNPPI